MARKAAGITQVQAAKVMGVDPSAFTRWEAGRNSISAYDLATLCRMFGDDFDGDLVINPPASRVEIKRRLGSVAAAAKRATRRGLLRPLPGGPADDVAPE